MTPQVKDRDEVMGRHGTLHTPQLSRSGAIPGVRTVKDWGSGPTCPWRDVRSAGSKSDGDVMHLCLA